jgi:hypothetical protein
LMPAWKEALERAREAVRRTRAILASAAARRQQDDQYLL